MILILGKNKSPGDRFKYAALNDRVSRGKTALSSGVLSFALPRSLMRTDTTDDIELTSVVTAFNAILRLVAR